MSRAFVAACQQSVRHRRTLKSPACRFTLYLSCHPTARPSTSNQHGANSRMTSQLNGRGSMLRESRRLPISNARRIVKMVINQSTRNMFRARPGRAQSSALATRHSCKLFYTSIPSSYLSQLLNSAESEYCPPANIDIIDKARRPILTKANSVHSRSDAGVVSSIPSQPISQNLQVIPPGSL